MSERIANTSDKRTSILNKLNRGLLVAGLATAAVLAAPQAANALNRTGFDRTFTVACPQGFNDVEHYVGTETTKQLNNGTQQTTEHVTATFTNSITGKSFSSTTNVVNTFNVDGSVVVSGSTFRINVPGQGSTIDTGRRVYDNGSVVFEAGPADSTPNICNLLAQ